MDSESEPEISAESGISTSFTQGFLVKKTVFHKNLAW